MSEKRLHLFGSRITLIKDTLSNLPVYYMSLFKMPGKISHQVEKLQRDFLWDGGVDKKDHLVSWKEVCRPKSEGGLGIGRIKERNLAPMGKLLWHFPSEKDSLWHPTISQKYGLHSNGWDCFHHFTTSWSIYGKTFANCILSSLLIPYLQWSINQILEGFVVQEEYFGILISQIVPHFHSKGGCDC